MGTNYYIKAQGPLGDQRIHVGKSSIGWVFAFEAQELPDESHLATTDDFRKAISGLVSHGPCVLVDEYGRQTDPDDFWQLVEVKKQRPGVRSQGTYQDEGNDFCRYEFS